MDRNIPIEVKDSQAKLEWLLTAQKKFVDLLDTLLPEAPSDAVALLALLSAGVIAYRTHDHSVEQVKEFVEDIYRTMAIADEQGTLPD